VAGPYLTIDLDKIEHNARAIVALCRQHDIEVTGVTKCVCGLPEVADAMLRGGIASIGESRLENIQRLQDAGVDAPFIQLRLPSLSGVEDVVRFAGLSLNSELSVLAALSEAALRQGRVHDVIVMVDLGDLREGVWPDDVLPFVRETLRLPGIRLIGLGTNLACFSGVVPSVDNMTRLVKLAEGVESAFGLALRWISGANSSGLDLIASGRMPKRVNHARLGESILLGRETVHRRPWPGTAQDAFVLYAEVLELKTKPSVPLGERGADALGGLPTFEERGRGVRALLNVGREDIDAEGLIPHDRGVAVIGATSGYLAVDVSGAAGSVWVGDELAFSLNYSALLAAMTSEYVKKRPLRGGELAAG
jgi:predicted amino acid racemase